MFAVFSLCVFMGGVERSGAADSVQQIECALTNDLNNLYVTADHGHILIVRRLIWSYHTAQVKLTQSLKALQLHHITR